jgi:hypothetical protein
MMSEHEKQILQGALQQVQALQMQLQQAQQKQVNPVMDFFFPSYYRLYDMMAARKLEYDASWEDVAREAYEAASAAYRQMGFDHAPRWQRMGQGFGIIEDKSVS